MSYDISVFCRDDRPIDVQELVRVSRENEQLLTVIRNHNDWSRYDPTLEGALEDGDMVCAFATQSPHAKALSKALIERDRGGIDAAFDRGDLGYSNVSILDGPDWADEEERDELGEEYGEEYVAYRDSARALYYIDTSAGRAGASHALHLFIAERILDLRGGMLEDPQAGSFRVRPVLT